MLNPRLPHDGTSLPPGSADCGTLTAAGHPLRRQQDVTSGFRWRSKGSVALFALLVLFFLLSVQRSAHKLLWFDELSTLNVVTQPTLARMFHSAPADANPPLTYLLTRVCVQVLGVNALALRLPALGGAALAIVCVYVFAARRFGQWAALTGATLLMFSPACDYGVEARPYGLMLGLTALVLVLWQSSVSSERRGGTLAGLAAAVFALTITHPFGILCAAVPVFAGESVRWWRTRRLDIALLVSMLIGFTGFAITLYFAGRTQAVLLGLTGGRFPAVSLPTIGKLCQAFRWNGSFRALELLLPAGAAAWWVYRRNRARHGEENVLHPGAPLHEWAAVIGLALSGFVVYSLTVVATHYFWQRYALVSTLGCFLLLAFTCGAIHRKTVLPVVFAACFLLMLKDEGPPPGSPKTVRGPAHAQGALLASADPDEPIVVENPVQYPQTWWYGSPDLRARLHYVADVQQAIPTGDFMGDAVLIAMHDAGSTLYPVDTLPGFLAANRHFLLWRGRIHNGSWLGEYLRAQHYELVTVASDDSGETLFRVSAPPSLR